MNIPLKISIGKLPLNFFGTLNESFQAIRKRIRAYVSSDNVMIGQTEGSRPASDVGLWFNNGTWHYWEKDRGAYIPTVQQMQDNTFLGRELRMTIRAIGITDDREYIVPDATGTVATLIDAVVPKETQILEEGENSINWSQSNNFIKKLTDDETLTFVNESPKKICVAIENNATTFDADFPGAVQWEGGTEPATPTGADALGLFYFVVIGSTTYGWLQDATPKIPQAEIPTDGPDSVGPHYYAPPPPAERQKFPY